MSEKQTSIKDYIEKWDLRPRARDELIILIDQVRDEAIEECAKIVAKDVYILQALKCASELRELKSKGEAK